jgi:lipid II:glycine glycyltransferase (peptidoglycan interpeptide bridge formation enzyme)
MPSVTPGDATDTPARSGAETARPALGGAALTVRPIAPRTHLAFAYARAETDQVSFLQCPAWGAVKDGWTAESIGWFEGRELVGVATVLYRRAPWLERSFAYLPEGPVIDWYGERGPHRPLGSWLKPLAEHARARGAFAVRIGPPLVARTWENRTVKDGMADEDVARFAGLTADHRDARALDLERRLASLGWQRAERGSAALGLADAQPRYHFRLSLDGRDESEVWAGLSEQWRQDIGIAERSGVRVERADAAQLPEFHRLYLATAARDGFTPRPLAYFERMFQSFGAEDPERVGLYLARRDGEALAAATLVRVGSYAWFGYGASADDGREARPSNALQWRMIQDCLARGIRVYDLRGVADTLDPDGPLFGLLRFKAGTGGAVVEYVGEWDLPLNRAFYQIFRLRTAWR